MMRHIHLPKNVDAGSLARGQWHFVGDDPGDFSKSIDRCVWPLRLVLQISDVTMGPCSDRPLRALPSGVGNAVSALLVEQRRHG